MPTELAMQEENATPVSNRFSIDLAAPNRAKWKGGTGREHHTRIREYFQGKDCMRYNRIDAMIDAARRSGLTLDLLHQLTQGLSRQAFRKVMGNASSMPSYMKSKDRPYLVRRARAPSSESL